MTSETGGAAFPVLPPLGSDCRAAAGYPYVAEGISVRDYFAAKALAGMASAYHEHWTVERAAEAAYELADAMLKERAK